MPLGPPNAGSIGLAVAFVLFVVLLVIAMVRGFGRTRDSLMSAKGQVPDDLRRADDGLDGTGAEGPGIGPFFPTN